MPASIHDNGDGTWLVSYLPDRTGRYGVRITYGGQDVPMSPYRVRATPSGDASQCKVSGRLPIICPQLPDHNMSSVTRP